MDRALDGVRVIDLSTGIAAAYACRILADAGADVVKVEDPQGDPLRWWSATGATLSDAGGALFRFLHHGIRSVVDLDGSQTEALVGDADVIVESELPPRVDAAALLAGDPGLVVLSVTPWGRAGPYAERPATEFTVQAESGCIATRGRLDRPPLMAGARIGEWVTGTYAAAGAAALIRRARRQGVGGLLDVSMLEVLNLAGTVCTDLTWSLFGRPPLERMPPARMVETPSIEPTADGWVGFTTNSRQQFDDFLVLIERPDLLGDEELARATGRTARYDEWTEIVRAWTTRHTTAEVIERASVLRIPVTPIGNGATVMDIDHFADRGVFVTDPAGEFRMPRRPWRHDGLDPPAPRPAPALGADTGRIERREARRAPASPRPMLPLAGVRVLDLTAWWAGPAASHFLAALGADVIHVESTRRIDAMRTTGGMLRGKQEWWEFSAIFLAVNTNKRGVTIDLSAAAGVDVARRLVGSCDVVLENFTPRVLDGWGLGWPQLHEAHPRAVLVRMPAFGLDGPWRDRTGFAQTMEQLSGLAWLTGYADDQPRIQRGPSDPNAGLQAAFATLVALEERDRTGEGNLVEVTMIEAALNSAAEQIVEWSAYGRLLERDGNRAPHAAPQGLYACAGRERWLALSVESDTQWEALVAALGAPAWATDGSLATHAGRRAAADRLDAELTRWAAERDLDETVEALCGAGVPAGAVVDPRTTSTHPQLVARGFSEFPDHPVAGRHATPTLPFRLTGVDAWIRHPAPTLGQHNRGVLGELAGLTDAEIDALEDAGVIGTRPHGL